MGEPYPAEERHPRAATLAGRPAAIVVGVDGSDASLRAAAYAVGLARRQQAPLVVVYVRSQPSGLLSAVDGGGAGIVAVIDVEDRIEAELLDAFRQALDGIDAQLIIRSGQPSAVLSEVAHEVQAGAVIVGRSESLAHRLTGSVPRRLVRCGRWPVTVVP
ncbi:universal stress protein [Winogradskya humida]|uniref:Universal stress protein A n=1 Tax=Winogradskya humida TaxID=113566 RepID=A0ABQ4A5I1_9ACTN|nr:universal stress protein [Actinoplanes humidus]GIE25974.1 universal stress protein A [Actinoplanes humidus]